MVKKVIAGVVLAAACSGAMAEWTPLHMGENNTFFIDKNTIRRIDGENVKIWDMVNFNSAQKDRPSEPEYFSTKTLTQFDCKNERMAYLSITAFTENMGDGMVAWSYSPDAPPKWRYAIPGSIAAEEMEVACKFNLKKH